MVISGGVYSVKMYITNQHNITLEHCSINTLVFLLIPQFFLLSGHCVLVNILKNTVLYYQQFLPAVLSHCDKVTAPVEKEFKVSVSLC